MNITPKQAQSDSVKIHGELLEAVPATKVLGIVVDKRLTLVKHVEQLNARCDRRVYAIKALVKSEDELLWFYKCCVSPTLFLWL